MPFRFSVTIVVLATALTLRLAAASSGAQDVRRLGSYSIQSDRLFVAGISSGGAMAVQLQVAYSQTFKGAAIYAGLPYYCAQDNIAGVTACPVPTLPIDVPALVKVTESWAGQGLIDPVRNLKGQPIYLWSGLLDTVVNQAAMNALESYYRDLGANVFQYDQDFAAEHGWESLMARSYADCSQALLSMSAPDKMKSRRRLTGRLLTTTPRMSGSPS